MKLCKDCKHFSLGACMRPILDLVHGGTKPLDRPAEEERWSRICGPQALKFLRKDEE